MIAEFGTDEKTIILKIRDREMAEDLAETFVKFTQSFMDAGMWEEAEECLHITNSINGRKEILDVRSNDL